jgi:hypothetical protein
MFDPLVEIIHSGTLDSWKERNEKALAGLFGSRRPRIASSGASPCVPITIATRHGSPSTGKITKLMPP